MKIIIRDNAPTPDKPYWGVTEETEIRIVTSSFATIEEVVQAIIKQAKKPFYTGDGRVISPSIKLK